MSDTKEFKLPEKITEVTSTAPRDLVIIGQPKIGKGVILGDFTTKYNALVIDLEKGGYEFIPARKMSIYTAQEDGDWEAFVNYIKIRNLLLKNKGKYEYLIVDGLSDLDAMSEIGGTLAYMDTVIGKKFNREDPKNPLSRKLEYDESGWRSVLSLPDGAGYQHTRKWFLDQIKFFSQISPYRIYAAHVADKYISDKGKDEVVGSEIFLTGKLKNIFASKVTSLAKVVAEDNKRWLNFDVQNDSIIAGSRIHKLNGKMLISEMDGDKLTTYWETIYN